MPTKPTRIRNRDESPPSPLLPTFVVPQLPHRAGYRSRAAALCAPSSAPFLSTPRPKAPAWLLAVPPPLPSAAYRVPQHPLPHGPLPRGRPFPLSPGPPLRPFLPRRAPASSQRRSAGQPPPALTIAGPLLRPRLLPAPSSPRPPPAARRGEAPPGNPPPLPLPPLGGAAPLAAEVGNGTP